MELDRAVMQAETSPDCHLQAKDSRKLDGVTQSEFKGLRTRGLR